MSRNTEAVSMPMQLLEQIHSISKEDGYPESEGWLTSRQWADAWGLTQRQAITNINKAVDAGLMESAKTSRKRVDGSTRSVPVYRAKPQ